MLGSKALCLLFFPDMTFGKKFEHYKCGLFDSREEHDACGVGFVANVHGERSTMASSVLSAILKLSYSRII